MLNNQSNQDELLHSYFTLNNCLRKDLAFHETDYNLKSTCSSIQNGTLIDPEVKASICKELFSNRQKTDPIRRAQQEKANSDILFTSPDIVNLTQEASQKLLEFRENSAFLNYGLQNQNSLYSQNPLQGAALSGEFLYKFSLTNIKENLNEEDSLTELEKKLSNLKLSLNTNERLISDYFRLIPIIEEFTEFGLDEIEAKFQYLNDIRYNIDIIMGKSREILIKINPILKKIFNHCESLINQLDSKIKDDKELISKLLTLLKLVFTLSFIFKFSYGFFILVKYVKKFDLVYSFENEFSKDFYEINKTPETAFNYNISESKGVHNKTWNTSIIEFSVQEVFKFQENLQGNINEMNPWELFSIDRETSLTNLGNKLYMYNDTFGLIDVLYSEAHNNIRLIDYNPFAFKLKKGSIISFGNEEAGIVVFLANSFFNEFEYEIEKQTRMQKVLEPPGVKVDEKTNNNPLAAAEEEELEEKEKQENAIDIIFSNNLSIHSSNDSNILEYKNKVKRVFENLRFWLADNLSFNDTSNEKNFVYTEKRILIPKGDIMFPTNSSNANNNKDKIAENSNIKELLKCTKVFVKNDLIFCLRPILKIKQDKKLYQKYFSQKYIFVVDIFEFDFLEKNSDGFKHLDSVVLRNETVSSAKGFDLSLPKYKRLDSFLDNLINKNCKSFLVCGGKMIMMNNELDFFVFDALYGFVEFVEKFSMTEEEQNPKHENNLYFLSKNNCFVLLGEKMIERDQKKLILRSAFDTLCREVPFNGNFYDSHSSVFYKLLRESLSIAKTLKEEDLNVTKFINKNFTSKKNLINETKENKHVLKRGLSILNDIERLDRDNSLSAHKRSENFSQGKVNSSLNLTNEIPKNFILYLLSNLANGANAKTNKKLNLPFEDVLCEPFLSYNDSENLNLILELLFESFADFFADPKKDLLQIVFCLVAILKLHVRNNSKLELDFSIYFSSKEKSEEIVLDLFNILTNLVLNNQLFNCQNEDMYESLCKNLLETLMEIIAFTFDDKAKLSYIIYDFITNVNMDHHKFSDISSISTNEQSQTKNFLLIMKSFLIEQISNLTENNANYVLSFILKDVMGKFILETYEDILLIRRESAKNDLTETNILKNNELSLHRVFDLFNIENNLIKILNSAVVKIMNININFGKKIHEQSLEKILKKISPALNLDLKNLVNQKIISFIVTLSKKICETANFIVEMHNSKRIKIEKIDNSFVFKSLNLIYNYINLINFETFPEFVFGNWLLVLKLLRTLIDNINNNFDLPLRNPETPSNKVNKVNYLLLTESKSEKEFFEFRHRMGIFFSAGSGEKQDQSSNSIKKFDFLVDNNFIDDAYQKDQYEVNLSPEFLLEYSNKEFNGDLYYDLYFELHYSNTNDSRKEKLFEVYENKNKKKFLIFEQYLEKGTKTEYILLRDISVNANLSFKFYNVNSILKDEKSPEAPNNSGNNSQDEKDKKPILYKLRVSNYKTFDENLKIIISTSKNFINRCIKYFAYYENADVSNDLNLNEGVKDLVSSNLFSTGLRQCKELLTGNEKLSSINKDLESFFSHLDESFVKKFEILYENFGQFTNEASGLEQFASENSDCYKQNMNVNDFNYNKGEDRNYEFNSKLLDDIKSNNVDFETLIGVKEYDYSEYEGKLSFNEISSLERKDFYLFKKLFLLFDFLIEKVNREYLIKGDLLDKIIIGIFFLSVKQDEYLEKVNKIFSQIFYIKENYVKFTSNALKTEEVVKLLEIKEFEQIFFIWKNVCQIRKIYKARKDLIFQQMDENFQDDKKVKLEYEKSQNKLIQIKSDLDPNKKEDANILKYFERYFEKLKLIFYVKSKEGKNSKSNLYEKCSPTRRSFKVNNQNNHDEHALTKKNSFSYLKNLMRKTLIEEDYENDSDTKNVRENKNRKKIKDYIHNIISALTNDDININNILACFQTQNVKIKFREISLLIVNDVLKNFSDCEAKADLVSNFYQNFNHLGNANQLPNILDNLNVTSTEHSESITNLFHEFLFNIIEELNTLFNNGNKEFLFPNEKLFHLDNTLNKNNKSMIMKDPNAVTLSYMQVLINCLIWNIKGRDFQFLLDVQFFQSIFNNQKNEILRQAKKAMFLEPTQTIYNSNLTTTLSIITVFDVYHISSLLTEIIKIYSILIIKRIVKENQYKNVNNPNHDLHGKTKDFGLVKSVSNLDFLNHNELLVHILEVYQIIIDEFNENVFYENKNALEKKYQNFNLAKEIKKLQDGESDEILNLTESESQIFFNNLIFNQKKLSNVLISILKLLVIQDSSIDFVFKDLSLFSRVLAFSIFANEKNIFIIFNVMKILMKNMSKNSEDFDYWVLKLKDFYTKTILEKFLSKNPQIKSGEDLLAEYSPAEIEALESIEFFTKFILSLKTFIARIKNNNDINKGLIIFEKDIFLASNNILNMIENSIEEKIYEFLRYFIMQSEFKERSLRILNEILVKNKTGGILISKILDSSIGYLHNSCRVVCNSKLNFSSTKINKIFEKSDLQTLVKKGYLIFEKSVFHLDEKAQESNFERYKGIKENNTEDCIVNSFLEENAQNLLKQMEINCPNLLFPFESEIMVDDEHCDFDSMIYTDKFFIENILKFLEDHLIKKNICMLTYLQSFIRIVKFIKKITLFIDNEAEILINLKSNDNSSAENYEEKKEECRDNNEKTDKLAYLLDVKKLIEDFIVRNNEFLEYFLIFDIDKTPVNLFSIDKIENIFFSYRPYDIKMLSENKKENILLFKNPTKNNKQNLKLFPFGNDSIQAPEETTSVENVIKSQDNITSKTEKIKSKDKKTDKKVEKELKIDIDYGKRSFKIFHNFKFLEEINFNDYQIIEDDKDRETKTQLKLDIFDKEKALEIIERGKNSGNAENKITTAGKYAIFLTDEFLETLDFRVQDSEDIEEYLDSIAAKFKPKKEMEEEQKENKVEAKQENKEETLDEKEAINSVTNQSNELVNKEEVQVKNESVAEESENKQNLNVENDNKRKENNEPSKEELNEKPEQKENMEENKHSSEDVIEKKEENKDNVQSTNIEMKGEEKKVEEKRQKNTPPLNQILFEDYIKSYHAEENSVVFIVNDEFYNKINKNFTCLALDYELLDEKLKEFLISPKTNPTNIKDEKDNTKNKASNEDLKKNLLIEKLLKILKGSNFRDISNDLSTKTSLYKDLQKFCKSNQNDQELGAQKETNENEKAAQDNENEEDGEKTNEPEIYQGYLEMLNIENIHQKTIPDSKLDNIKVFEKLFNNIELIQFQEQKESQVKSIGFHILKQHLRFLSLYYNKKYFESYEKKGGDLDKQNFGSQTKFLLKYLKLLYFQANLKEKYFDLRLENQFLKSKIIKIIQKVIISNENKIVNSMFNLEEQKLITYKDQVSAESELINSDFLFFLEELMRNINISNYKITKADKSGIYQKNILNVLKILSIILKSNIDNLDYSKIVNMMEIFSEFLDNAFLFINNNKENHNDPTLSKFVISLIEFFLKDSAFKLILKTQLKKLYFSNFVIEFALKFIKFFERSRDVIELPKELRKKTESFTKAFYTIYKQLDIVDNKLESENLLNILIDNTSVYKDMINKKHKMPNLRNFYCFTLKPNVFKVCELNYTNMIKNEDEFLALTQVSYNNTKRELEYKEIDYCGYSDILNNKSTLFIQQFENTEEKKTNNTTEEEKKNNQEKEEIKKQNLIYCDNLRRIENKNFAIIDNGEGNNPLVFNLPKGVQSIYSSQSNDCLIYRLQNKLYFKGKLETTYLTSKISKKIEDIERKGENIIKFFEGGILITDKFIHTFFYISSLNDDSDSDSEDSEDNDNESYCRIRFKSPFDPNKVVKAHANESGILLADSDNNMFYAGEFIFNPNTSGIEFVKHLKKMENFSSKLKVIDFRISRRCAIFLFEDPADGKAYLYCSGNNRNDLYIMGRSESYLKNIRIPKLCDTPIIKFTIICNYFLIALSEQKEIFYFGKMLDSRFNEDSKKYNEPTKWEWPSKNGYEVLDFIDPGCDGIIFKLKNLKTNQEELFMNGQVYLFNNCEAKFIFMDDEPLKIDLSKLLKKTTEKENNENDDSEGNEKEEDEENSDNQLKDKNLIEDHILEDLDEEQKRLLIELEQESCEVYIKNNKEDINIIDEDDVQMNEEIDSVKDKVNNEVDNANNLLMVSRFDLSKFQVNNTKVQKGKTENEGEIENEEIEDNKAEFIKEYGKQKVVDINTSYIIRDIKICYSDHDEMDFRFAYVLGYEIDERKLNLDLLRDKYAKDLCKKENPDDKLLNKIDENKEIEEEEKENNEEKVSTSKPKNIRKTKNSRNLRKRYGAGRSNKSKKPKKNQTIQYSEESEESELIESEEEEEFEDDLEEVDTTIKVTEKPQKKKPLKIEKQEKIEGNEKVKKLEAKELNVKNIYKDNPETIIIACYNKGNVLNNYIYSKPEEETICIKLNVYQNEDAYLINTEIFPINKLTETIKTQLNLQYDWETEIINFEKAQKEDLINSNIENNKDEPRLSLKLCKMFNLNSKESTFTYISENLDELIHIFFLSEDLIVYKKILSETYFDKKSKLNKRENIELLQIPKDADLHELFPDIFIKAKGIIKNEILANLNPSVLKEFRNAKYNFRNQNKAQEGSKNLLEYLQKIYKNSDNLKVFLNKLHVEVVEKLLEIYSESIQGLIATINVEYENSLSKLVIENMHLLERSVKDGLIEQEINVLGLNDQRRNIKVDRTSARKFKQLGICDKKFEKTIFSQVYREMKGCKPDDFRKVKNEILFKVNLKGEGAIDAGGPGREIFTQIFEDLMSNRHDLFIQTPNQKTKSGLGRDLWTINPAANTIYHLKCFEFIGKLFGYSIVSKVYCPINLPGFVWKQILRLEPKPLDIEEIDIVAYNSIVKLCLFPDKYKEELNALFDYATFTACLSNGEEVELIENGRNVNVNENNYKEFIQLYLNARYREIREQADSILKGIKYIIPMSIINLLSTDDLSERVSGPKTFDMELLRKNTTYSGYKSTDKVIQYFWKFLESCTIEEKIQYLRFVWGRTTLPNSDENFDQKHGIDRLYGTSEQLPVSHTCYFSIDIPEYTSYSQLKTKLSYAMNNSYVISDNQNIQLDFD